MNNFTDEELAGLSDEERAALEDIPEDEGEMDEEEVAAAEAQPDEPAPDEPAGEPVAEAVPAEEPVAPGQFVPRFQGEVPADLAAQMQQINEAKRTLGQQYQDGEIDWAEFESKRDELDEKALDLREAKSQVDLMAKLQAQTEAQHWQWEQDRFFAQKSNSLYKEDELAYVALDHTIKRLASDAAHAGKPMAWFLEEADRVVRAKFAPTQVATTTQPTTKIAQKTAPKMPPNLGDLPAAELPATGDPDEFSKLDKLSGMELERAISKLTPEQQDRYLMG
jgi:hypothetical protein